MHFSSFTRTNVRTETKAVLKIRVKLIMSDRMVSTSAHSRVKIILPLIVEHKTIRKLVLTWKACVPLKKEKPLQS